LHSVVTHIPIADCYFHVGKYGIIGMGQSLKGRKFVLEKLEIESYYYYLKN